MAQRLFFQQLTQFLKNQVDIRRPFLLALSGGPDSTALFHFLASQGIPFAAAHVDHGWREESCREAQILREKARNHGIRFHLKELKPQNLSGNLEDACREERLRFFGQLCKEEGYQAVMLGHHGDDQAETVLKRVLEGAGLTRLASMREVSKNGELTLWRPLLPLSKKQILDYLSSIDQSYFEDSSNRDPAYLRSRMRETILPELEKGFGKMIAAPLNQLAEEASELSDYLDGKVAPYLEGLHRSPMGAMLDLSGKMPSSSVELKHLVRVFCQNRRLILSRDALETVVLRLHSGASNVKVSSGKEFLYIDRKLLFHPVDFSELPASLSLTEGSYREAGWEIRVTQTRQSRRFSCWRTLWESGGLEATLPIGSYRLEAPRGEAPFAGSVPLREWWSKHKIPAFFRNSIPLLVSEGRQVHEFLTGKALLQAAEGENALHIQIGKIE